MKIAIDISPLQSGHKVRGVGYYVNLLVKNIEQHDTTNKYTFFDSIPPHDADIVHYPYFDPFFLNVPFRRTKPTVVTVHDLTPIKFKKHFPSGIKGTLRWNINRNVLRRMDAIITDSKASEHDVNTMCGIQLQKISVVYLAVSGAFTNTPLPDSRKKAIVEKYSLPDSFLLYVGDATWNKNLPRIIQAVKNTQEHLVLVGKALGASSIDTQNPWNKDLILVQREIHNNDQLSALGYVEEDDLVDLYKIATLLLMPSLYEGFGLPVLEAMSTGCPVVTSREGSLPEVAGNASFYVDANSETSISEAITKLSHNELLRKSLSKKGLIQAKQFSIEKMMRETIDVYNSLLQ